MLVIENKIRAQFFFNLILTEKVSVRERERERVSRKGERKTEKKMRVIDTVIV